MALANSFLGKLPDDIVGRLFAEGDRVDYPAGAVVYRETSAPRAALVVTGLVRVYMSSPEGRQSRSDMRGRETSSASRSWSAARLMSAFRRWRHRVSSASTFER